LPSTTAVAEPAPTPAAPPPVARPFFLTGKVDRYSQPVGSPDAVFTIRSPRLKTRTRAFLCRIEWDPHTNEQTCVSVRCHVCEACTKVRSRPPSGTCGPTHLGFPQRLVLQPGDKLEAVSGEDAECSWDGGAIPTSGRLEWSAADDELLIATGGQHWIVHPCTAVKVSRPPACLLPYPMSRRCTTWA
jgi:hypothetical protein